MSNSHQEHCFTAHLHVVTTCSVLHQPPVPCPVLFFFNDTATTEIYTLSLHDALPISTSLRSGRAWACWWAHPAGRCRGTSRSEEHTSELQSHHDLVCRLLLEKKKPITEVHSPSLPY